jgi:predicted nucleic acid-binding protein
MSLVFADSFYFVARLNRNDQFHERALHFTLPSSARLITTEWVLAEVADALAKSDFRPHLREVFRDLKGSTSSEVIAASTESFDRALEFYHQRRDKEWSFTDCTSFLAMHDRGIREALTGDHHFEQAGFIALLK